VLHHALSSIATILAGAAPRLAAVAAILPKRLRHNLIFTV
jgi:hypothetical protein